MRVAIIGAGFTGLAAAFHLAKSGADIEVFESSTSVGGLASGFRDSAWEWPLESHYHHLFTSDHDILNLAEEIGVKVDFFNPKTSTLSQGSIHQLDSPQSLLRFPYLPLTDRLRTGAGLALMKFNPFWQPFEKLTARGYITAVMGSKSWSEVWEPLFVGKFGQYADQISASWFWARIYKRSSSLGYPQGGFQKIASQLALQISALGGKFHYGQKISQIKLPNTLILNNGAIQQFDRILCTLPPQTLANITPGLPADYDKSLRQFKGLGAVTLVLALKRQFLTDGTYWLNINDRKFPFLAVVEHTNMVSPEHYGGDHLLYIGNYLPKGHEFFHQTDRSLLDLFLPHLQKINPNFKRSWVRKSFYTSAPYAQPIVTLDYSQKIPSLTTLIPGLYLASMQQVYPWDRGTNYAVKMGIDAAKKILAQT